MAEHWSWPVDVAQLFDDTTAQVVGPRPRRPGLSNRLGLWRPLHVTARKNSGCMAPCVTRNGKPIAA